MTPTTTALRDYLDSAWAPAFLRARCRSDAPSRGTREGMTNPPSEPIEAPTSPEAPDDLPDGNPSRPHGDPVMPDPDLIPGSPAEPQSNAETDFARESCLQL